MDKIICVGKNYLAHAQELGDAVPEKPVLFLKPPSVLKQAFEWNSSLCVTFPSDTAVQPECELVMRVGQDAYQLTETEAKQIISHVSVGLDMTLRAKQTALKQQGHPWTLAKVFKDSRVFIELCHLNYHFKPKCNLSSKNICSWETIAPQLCMG